METIRIDGDLLVFSKVSKNELRGNNLRNRRTTGYSDSARSRMARYLRSCTSDYKYLITLTWPNDPATWLEFRSQFNRFIERCRYQGLITATTSWFWFIEFQERGAPHIHFYSTTRIPRIWLSKAWFECVGSGDERHLRAGTNIIQFSNRTTQRQYALKYAQKQEQKTVPEMFTNAEFNKKWDLPPDSIGRLWGIVGVRAVLSADSRLSPTIVNSEPVKTLLNKLDAHINYCFEFGLAKSWSNDWSRSIEFKRSREARIALHIIGEISSQVRLLNASRTRIDQPLGYLLRRIQRESPVMQSKMGQQREKFSSGCYLALMN